MEGEVFEMRSDRNGRSPMMGLPGMTEGVWVLMALKPKNAPVEHIEMNKNKKKWKKTKDKNKKRKKKNYSNK